MTSSEMHLPAHGRLACRKCWVGHEGVNEYLSANTKFKLVNDPAAWGCRDPQILVLGMTKGNTQSLAMKDDPFDEIPYKTFRERLTVVLQLVGLARHVEDVSELINKTEGTFAWGSVIRCSLTGYDKKNNRYSGESGKVLPAFSDAEMSAVVSNCFSTYLGHLPTRLKLVVLLGNSDDYMRRMRKLVSTFYRTDFRENPADEGVSYEGGGQLWVHVAHPSRGNGYYNNFLSDAPDVAQGKKRELARRAIERLRIS